MIQTHHNPRIRIRIHKVSEFSGDVVTLGDLQHNSQKLVININMNVNVNVNDNIYRTTGGFKIMTKRHR